MVVPEFARQSDTTLESVRAKYSSFACVPLFEGPGRLRHGLGDELFDVDQLAVLRRAWLGAIVAHPRSYLRHRAAMAKNQFGSYRGPLEGLFFVPSTVAYRDNPPGEAALTGSRERLAEVLRRTRGWMIFMPVVYLAIAFGAVALGWRRRAELAGQVALAAAGSGLFLVLPLVVVAPGAELRYCGWLFASSVVALAACFSRPAVSASAKPPRGTQHR